MKVNRKLAPEIQKADNISPINTLLVKLDNDIPVYLLDSGTQEVTKIELLFQAGSSYQLKPLIARFTSKLIPDGTHKHSAYEIALKLEYYGAYLQTSVEKDGASIILNTLNIHLDKVLSIFADVVKNPSFPENEFQQLANKQKQIFIDEQKKVNDTSIQIFNSLCFGEDHIYGKMVTLNDFDNISQKDIIQFHRNHYHPANCSIIIAGRLPAGIISQINQTFGGRDWLKSYPDFPHIVKPLPPYIPQKRFHQIDGVVQNAVRIGKRLFSLDHKDFAKFGVLNTILGGYFGSRLMTNIREDKGYTYGINSMLIPFKMSGLFFIATEVGVNVWQQTIKEIYKELNELRAEPVSTDELELVKNYTLGNILRMLDGPFSTAMLLKSLIPFSIDLNEHINNTISAIHSVSPEEILALANAHLAEESFCELLTGKN